MRPSLGTRLRRATLRCCAAAFGDSRGVPTVEVVTDRTAHPEQPCGPSPAAAPPAGAGAIRPPSFPLATGTRWNR